MSEENNFVDENGRELSFDEILADASVQNANRLAEDPEWAYKITIHMHEVITAFSVGIQQSFPYYVDYQLPPNFEKVMNKMSLLLQDEFRDHWKNLECIEVSLLKLKGVYRRLAMSIPEYVEWNDIDQSSGLEIESSIYSMRTTPSFIDLDVPPHQAVIYLRNCERDHKRFDKEFEDKYGKLK